MPILFIAPNQESFATEARINATRNFVPSMEVVRIDSGHFVMLEEPAAVTRIIGDWVAKQLKETT